MISEGHSKEVTFKLRLEPGGRDSLWRTRERAPGAEGTACAKVRKDMLAIFEGRKSSVQLYYHKQKRERKETDEEKVSSMEPYGE